MQKNWNNPLLTYTWLVNPFLNIHEQFGFGISIGGGIFLVTHAAHQARHFLHRQHSRAPVWKIKNKHHARNTSPPGALSNAKLKYLKSLLCGVCWPLMLTSSACENLKTADSPKFMYTYSQINCGRHLGKRVMYLQSENAIRISEAIWNVLIECALERAIWIMTFRCAHCKFIYSPIKSSQFSPLTLLAFIISNIRPIAIDLFTTGQNQSGRTCAPLAAAALGILSNPRLLCREEEK